MAPLGELQGGAGLRHLGELVVAAVDQALAGTALGGHLVVAGACRTSKGLQLCLKLLKLRAAGRDRLLQVRVAALEELRKLDLLGEEGSADLLVARAEELGGAVKAGLLLDELCYDRRDLLVLLFMYAS